MTSGRAPGTLLLVRHGRTAANRCAYVGWANPALDETGEEQAAALVAALDGRQIDRIYSSPLLRAIQTATPLAAARRLDIHIRPALCELNYGDFEGLSKDVVPLEIRRRHRRVALPGGESLVDLYQRVNAFSHEIVNLLQLGVCIVVVGHFWSNRILLGCLNGMPFDAIVDAPPYKPANGSIVAFRCDAAVPA